MHRGLDSVLYDWLYASCMEITMQEREGMDTKPALEHPGFFPFLLSQLHGSLNYSVHLDHEQLFELKVPSILCCVQGLG